MPHLQRLSPTLKGQCPEQSCASPPKVCNPNMVFQGLKNCVTKMCCKREASTIEVVLCGESVGHEHLTKNEVDLRRTPEASSVFSQKTNVLDVHHSLLDSRLPLCCGVCVSVCHCVCVHSARYVRCVWRVRCGVCAQGFSWVCVCVCCVVWLCAREHVRRHEGTHVSGTCGLFWLLPGVSPRSLSGFLSRVVVGFLFLFAGSCREYQLRTLSLSMCCVGDECPNHSLCVGGGEMSILDSWSVFLLRSSRYSGFANVSNSRCLSLRGQFDENPTDVACT